MFLALSLPALVLAAPVLAEARSVLDELDLPPPLFAGDPEQLAAFRLAPGAMKGYARDASVEDIFRDPEKYPFRVAVLRARQELRDTSLTRPRAPKPITRIDAPVTDKTKKLLREPQEELAIAIAKLELALLELEQVGQQRATETRRWQAHYDYTHAALRLRMAMLNEYNKLLGDVRTERLPDLPDGSPGWRLVPAESLQSLASVKKEAQHAAEALKAVAADRKGTPWEALSRRALLAPPGLRWEPIGK